MENIKSEDNFFFDTLESYQNKIAIITKKGEKISYQQLIAQVDQFALQLGEKRGLFMIESVNELPAMIAYLAALRNRHPIIFLRYVTDNSDVNASVIELYKPNWIYRRDNNGNWTLHSKNTPSPNLHPQLAVLLSTSGSTGNPKLVRLSRQNIVANAQSIAQYLQIIQTDKAITTLPFHYSYGLSVINSHFAVGATLLLTDESVIEPSFWNFFETYQATSFAGVPYTFDLLDRIHFLETKKNAIAHLRYITQAGGKMPLEKVKTWAAWTAKKNVDFFVMYGQTEATARMAYLPPDLVLQYPAYIGFAIPQGEFFLIDDHDQVIEEREKAGRLVYRGPNVMMGYALSPEDLAKPAEIEQLITGDIACCNAIGLYRIVGRESRFSKIFGLRIDLDAIEDFLLEKQIKSVVVSNDENIIIAVLESEIDNTLFQALALRLKIPSTTFILLKLDKLPVLSSGKVDYMAIVALANQQHEGKTEDESFPAIFQSAMGLRNPPAGDATFVSLGGDSLTYVRVSIAIEKILGYLPPHWEHIALHNLEKTLPKKKSVFVELDVEILWRALAIIGVVLTHVIAEHKIPLHLSGGANLLLLLVAFNIARFQSTKLFNGMISSVLMPFMRKVLLPYYLILSIYQSWHYLVGKEINGWAFIFLSNYQSQLTSFLQPYWFIETTWQILLIFTSLFIIPAYRKIISLHPYLFGILLFSIALVISNGSGVLNEVNYLKHTPDKLMYIFLVGWCLYFSKSNLQKLIITLLILVTFRFLTREDFSYSLWLIFGSFSILWMPRIKTPKFFHTIVLNISAASFYIYLTHMIPVHLLVRMSPLATQQNIIAVTFVSLLFGVCVYKLLMRVNFLRI